ncbi:MAG TPA: aminotransferase class V-fold PLP-dependent enzyme [Anaerolineales bacterium]|nr:aminotransferase class V-fold PLP-dependent enzyme [Anaerolineales bacterium]
MLDLKQHFLLDPSVIFLNHGSFGACPKPVIEVYQNWQRELERQPVEFLGRRAADLLAESRAVLAGYLCTQRDNLIYITNATVGVNIVAHSLDLGPGDEVLATDHEYGACDRTWRFLAQKNGFAYINQPISAPVSDTEEFQEQFWQSVTARTKLIFLSHITSPTATIFPVAEVCRRAREQGILTLVDGAHAPGQISLDLEEIGADFYTGNLHKWLCAPKGSAFLYARPAVQDLLEPLIVSWGWQSETPGPSRFVDLHEWGGTRDLSAFLSVPAAIEFQRQHAWERVRVACHALATEAEARIRQLTGLSSLYSGSDWFAQMVSAQLPLGTDTVAFKEFLYKRHHIEVPLIEWNERTLVRVSFQGYNTREDVDSLIAALGNWISGRR